MESASTRVAVRSCLTCAKAKARCVRRLGEDVCERCARLEKDCQVKEAAVLKRRKPSKTTRAAQLDKLESKIETLVNALATQQPIVGKPDYGQPSPPVSQVSSERTINRTHEILYTLCHQPDELERASATADTTSPNARNVKNRSSAVTLSEAKTLLTRFRQFMSAGMPFIVLTPGLTAQELYKTRPVLLRAITTVALFHDLSRQQVLVKDLIRDLSERVMINGEKSIDVLQAIIIFVAWAHPHAFWSQQVTNLLHLAMAITIDMGLDRNVQQCGSTVFNLAPRTPSMEEHRILLGLFYLSSMMSSSFKKMDAMQFTRHMEISLTSLEHAREYDSDSPLVQMVRLQRVIESIHTTSTSNVPAKIYTKWELSLNELVDDKSKPLSSTLDDLYNCVSAIKAFLEVFFSIPSSAYLLAPFAVFGQFAHAFIVLTKLASLDIEGWDLKALKNELNFFNVIDESARRFDEAVRSSVDGITVDNDAFAKWAQRVRYMKSVYGTKFSELSDNGQSAQDVGKPPRAPDDLGHPTPPGDILNADFFNYLDADFWSAVDFTTDLGFTAPEHGIAQ